MTLKELFETIGVERDYVNLPRIRNAQLADLNKFLRAQIVKKRESGGLEVQIWIPFENDMRP